MTLKWKLLIVIVVLWILGTAGAAIQVRQTAPPPGSTVFVETLKTVLLLLGGLGVVLPTYLNIWQSIETSGTARQRLRFDKMNNSFDLIQRWDDTALLLARRFSRELRKERDNLSDKELLRRIEENPDLKQSVILIFNYWESVRISVFGDRVDEDVVKRSTRDVFVDIYVRFLPWIKTHSPAYQKDIQELYDRWQKG